MCRCCLSDFNLLIPLFMTKTDPTVDNLAEEVRDIYFCPPDMVVVCLVKETRSSHYSLMHHTRQSPIRAHIPT